MEKHRGVTFVFLDSKTHMVIEELGEQNTDAFLEVGDTVHAKFHQKGTRFFKIVNMEENDVVKVYVKKMPLHYTELIQVVIITVLGYFIIRYASQILFN